MSPGTIIEARCHVHGFGCGCAPGPWRFVSVDEDGHVRAVHVEKRLTNGRAPTLGVHISQVREAPASLVAALMEEASKPLSGVLHDMPWWLR